MRMTLLVSILSKMVTPFVMALSFGGVVWAYATNEPFVLTPEQEQLVCRCSFEDLFTAGRICKLQGRNKEALKFFQACRALRENDWIARWEEGDLYGLFEDLPRLWQGMAYRWKFKKKFQDKLWTGEALTGKVFLAHAIWGLGDTFQYVRYLKLLKQQGATVILVAPRALVPLLSLCPYIDQITTNYREVVHYDYQAPLVHLPSVFNTTIDSIPFAQGYLVANDVLVSRWKQCLKDDTNLKIGICWRGQKRADPQTDLRPIPLELLAPLAAISGVSLYSLQQVDGVDEIASITFKVNTFSHDFDRGAGPFMDTAAVMKNLDLIITIDTSIAHLAGGLGVPVWVLLPYASENRFFLERSDSPWYKSMRLFRQPSKADWISVVQNVVAVLEEKIQQKKLSCPPVQVYFSLLYD